MNNYNISSNNRPPPNMMNTGGMPGLHNINSVDDFGSNLNNNSRIQRKQRPPNNNIMNGGPPPMNNMMGGGPPPMNNMMGGGPPPMNNNMMGGGPPPMNQLNGAGRHPQKHQQMMRNGQHLPQHQQMRNMSPMGGPQQMRNMTPMGGPPPSQQQQSPIRNMGAPQQMRNISPMGGPLSQQQRNMAPVGGQPPQQMRNAPPPHRLQQQRNPAGGPLSQQQQSPMRNMGGPPPQQPSPMRNGPPPPHIQQQQSSPVRNMGGPPHMRGQSPQQQQQMRNMSPMRDVSPTPASHSSNKNMNPYMQNNDSTGSQVNNNPYGGTSTSLNSNNDNPYGSSGSVNNTFDRDINNNFAPDEPHSHGHQQHSRFSSIEVPDNNTYQDVNVIKPQRFDNGNIAANNRISESIQPPSRKEVLRPLDYNEFNRRRAAAETNESPKVQLLWIRAIIESTQDPKLISTIDIDGSYLHEPLTSSKDIRKNRDVFLHKGLKKLKKLVSKDYPDANYYLGTLYTNGTILEKNYDKAFDYYMKAANSGNGEGMYRAAICYEMGIGTEKDEQLAFELYSKASLLQIVPAIFKLGMIYLKGSLNQLKSAPSAIEWLEKAASLADERNPHALFELGKLYEGFYPIQQQHTQDDSDLSEEDSNFLKELKIIIPAVDERTALSLYIKAAKLNYSPAQSKLGWCYEYGKLGCNVDSKRSIGWYCKAAEQGYALAEMGLCGWYLTGAKGLLESNDHEAYIWATKAAEKGLSKAEYALGHFKETGLGTEKNLDEAREWYSKAANQGHPKAIQKMNMLFG